ncbi:hybrid sensor histidine kinase/response regulator [Oxalobacteraceae bacterium]|nr:hybrid sensor histidine kinase/response regulator [Oxalobacteraceae bacterium]
MLLVEDSDSDAELVLRCLRKAGIDVTHERIETGDAMRAALASASTRWDIVISDHNLPAFSASAALALLREVDQDLPFIVVSNNIGEETAVALMRAGAHDYVMKGDLARLPPAVKRELSEAAQRRERKRADEALRELNEQLETRVEERTSELRQAMAQIIESEKLASLGMLVAGVSHELNTPIGNMVLAATALYDKLKELVAAAENNALTRSGLLLGLQECQGASAIISRNGHRSSELIDSFKRVAVDQTSQRRRSFDLRATVQDSLAAMGAILRRAHATVELRIPDGIAMDSFPGHLEQIVNNIIMNSITHGFDGREGGNIVIDAGCCGGIVELRYSDDGHGIAAELQHKVFEPFYTTKLGQGGSGLGLSIVHNLVQAIFKGQLKLDSAPGQGVHLTFTFPALTPHTPPH